MKKNKLTYLFLILIININCLTAQEFNKKELHDIFKQDCFTCYSVDSINNSGVGILSAKNHVFLKMWNSSNKGLFLEVFYNLPEHPVTIEYIDFWKVELKNYIKLISFDMGFISISNNAEHYYNKDEKEIVFFHSESIFDNVFMSVKEINMHLVIMTIYLDLTF